MEWKLLFWFTLIKKKKSHFLFSFFLNFLFPFFPFSFEFSFLFLSFFITPFLFHYLLIISFLLQFFLDFSLLLLSFFISFFLFHYLLVFSLLLPFFLDFHSLLFFLFPFSFSIHYWLPLSIFILNCLTTLFRHFSKLTLSCWRLLYIIRTRFFSMNLQHVHCLQESMVRILPFSLNDNITFRNARSDLYYWILFIAKPRFIQARKQEKKIEKEGIKKESYIKTSKVLW